jgi:hypothetical protein
MRSTAVTVAADLLLQLESHMLNIEKIKLLCQTSIAAPVLHKFIQTDLSASYSLLNGPLSVML